MPGFQTRERDARLKAGPFFEIHPYVLRFTSISTKSCLYVYNKIISGCSQHDPCFKMTNLENSAECAELRTRQLVMNLISSTMLCRFYILEPLKSFQTISINEHPASLSEQYKTTLTKIFWIAKYQMIVTNRFHYRKHMPFQIGNDSYLKTSWYIKPKISNEQKKCNLGHRHTLSTFSFSCIKPLFKVQCINGPNTLIFN